MSVEELRQHVEKYRDWLKQIGVGKAVKFTETGPPNMALIDALVAVVAAQEKRIEALESRLAGSR